VAPAAFAAGGQPTVTNRETVQAYLDANGKVKVARVYDQIAAFGSGSITVANPVSTSNLRNRDGFGNFDVRDGKAVQKIDVDGEARLRTVSDFKGDLPVEVQISYSLDGKPIKAKDVVGKSGLLEVRYTVKNVTGTEQQLITGQRPEQRRVVRPHPVGYTRRLRHHPADQLRPRRGLRVGAFGALATWTLPPRRGDPRRAQRAGTFSGGEQQMLAMGRALMSHPKLLMLDEPSMGLSPIMMQRIMTTIIELKSQGTTILLVEQNAQAALRLADHGHVLEVGKVVISDTGRALLGNERVRKAYLGED